MESPKNHYFVLLPDESTMLTHTPQQPIVSCLSIQPGLWSRIRKRPVDR